MIRQDDPVEQLGHVPAFAVVELHDPLDAPAGVGMGAQDGRRGVFPAAAGQDVRDFARSSHLLGAESEPPGIAVRLRRKVGP